MSSDEEHSNKEVAFYSAAATAWFTTRFEKDKHLLSLSVAAIGLLVTLATAIGVKSTLLAGTYIAAVLFFLACILTVLYIFGRNAKHLSELIEGETDEDSVLEFLDKVAVVSFVLGVIFTSLVGLVSAVEAGYGGNGDASGNTKVESCLEDV